MPDLSCQHHSDTLMAAAEAIESSRSTLRQRMLKFLCERGRSGATDEEIQEELEMNPSTQRPRRIELVHMGQIFGSHERRLTRSGRKAVVWKMAEHGNRSKRGDMTTYFSGATYEAEHDHDRLLAQLERVRALMKDGEWRTLFEISSVTRDPLQSVSARLRDFRKKRFGSHTVNRRRRGAPGNGLFEYQLVMNNSAAEETETVEAEYGR